MMVTLTITDVKLPQHEVTLPSTKVNMQILLVRITVHEVELSEHAVITLLLK